MKKLSILIALVLIASTASADQYIKVSNREVKRIKTITVEEVYNLDVLLIEKKNIKENITALNSKLDDLNLQITAVRNAGAVAETEVNA
jgi:hypothetical protein